MNKRLKSKRLHTAGVSNREIVLLHGWSSTGEVWDSLAESLLPWASLTTLELPGFFSGERACAASSVEELIQLVLGQAPPEALYFGWSMGGQLATTLAHRHPERVQGLITICSNPRFVRELDWPGMPPSDFVSFRAEVASDLDSGLRRFDLLQSDGGKQGRNIARSLGKMRQDPDQGRLIEGLDMLEQWDTRVLLSNLQVPQLHLFAELDALVPVGVAESLVDLLVRSKVDAGVQVVPGASHAAPLDSPAALANQIIEFLNQPSVKNNLSPASGEPSKSDVANSFSKAASMYDSVAHLQQEVGACLLQEYCKAGTAIEVVLDLGCGTGYFLPALKEAYPGATHLGLDLAYGMVEYSSGQYPGMAQWLVGDAECLPLADNSVDMIFSSLAIQWCHNPSLLFSELARVLKPGGRCVFSTLGPQTLKELRYAWAAVDDHQHVNKFLAAEVLLESAKEIADSSLVMRGQDFKMQYDRVRDLLTELKTLGAHNMNRGRQTGLTGRRSLQGMLTAYEDWRSEGKLPATYDVLFGVLEKNG